MHGWFFLRDLEGFEGFEGRCVIFRYVLCCAVILLRMGKFSLVWSLGVGVVIAFVSLLRFADLEILLSGW